jgi:hypothetical protein
MRLRVSIPTVCLVVFVWWDGLVAAVVVIVLCILVRGGTYTRKDTNGHFQCVLTLKWTLIDTSARELICTAQYYGFDVVCIYVC